MIAKEARDALQSSSEPGDLGRRIRYWREHRGFTRQRLAAAASIDDGYLDYLETNASSMPSYRTIARLAVALGTTATELLGGNVERLEGRAYAAPKAVLLPLASEECWTLLGRGGVARLVFDAEEGPTALPVNFAVKDGLVFLRTAAGSSIHRIPEGSMIALQADHIDDAMRGGWSVLLRGRCEHLGCSPELGYELGVEVLPWAGEGRDCWLRLSPNGIAGRVIEEGA